MKPITGMKRVNDRKARNTLNKSIKGFQKINKKLGELKHSRYTEQQREFRKLLGF